MKKLLYLLLIVPFAMMISSCSSDKDIPDVNVTIGFDNAAISDGVVYVLADSTFQVTGITTKSVDSNNASALVNIDYYWNYMPAPGLTWSSMPLNINMAEMPVVENGANVLGMDATLLETDKSIAYCTLRIPIKAVDTEADVPSGQTLGQCSMTLRVGASDSK